MFDTTDAEYDSVVFLDHLTFGVDQDGASCEEGRTLVTNISADEAQSLTGSTNGYSIPIEAVGGSPAPPDPGPVSAPLELDTLAAIGALLAPGFVYVPGSTIGITSAEPAGGADHQLTWLGPFAFAPAPNDSVADVRFRVTVPKQPGTYNASAALKGEPGYFILPTLPSAPVEVVAPTADLAVAFEQRPDPAPLAADVEVDLVVTNHGPQPANNATLAAELPGSLVDAAASTSQGSCKLADILECELEAIDVGASVTITVTGVLGGAELALSAKGGALQIDSNLENNTLETEARVIVADEDVVPTIGETVATKANKGAVLVKLPDEATFVDLGENTELPVGTTIDARKGEVKIAATFDEAGDVQAASVARAKFVVRQRQSGLATLKLLGGDFSQCVASKKSADEARKTQRFIKGRRARPARHPSTLGPRQGPLPDPGSVRGCNRSRHGLANRRSLRRDSDQGEARCRDRSRRKPKAGGKDPRRRSVPRQAPARQEEQLARGRAL